VGKLEKGLEADLSLFDPQQVWQVESEKFLSEGKNTPFSGWGFNGKTVETFVKGKSVYKIQST
jgi:dihydroorotase